MNRTHVCWKCRLLSSGQQYSPPLPRLRKGLSQGQSRHGVRALSSTGKLPATPVETQTSPAEEALPQFSRFRFNPPDPPLLRKEIQVKLRDWQNATFKEQERERIEKAKEVVPARVSLVTELANKTRAQRDLTEDQEDDTGQYSVLRGLDDAQIQSQFFDESVASFEDEPLKLGDLVDFGGRCIPAIYLRTSDRNTKFPTAQLFTRFGEIVEMREDFIHFCAPGFLTAQELEPILPYVPAAGKVSVSPAGLQNMSFNVPRELGSPIIAKILAFEGDASEIYRANAQVMDNCLALLSPNEPKPIVRTLTEAAGALLKLSSDSEKRTRQLWAVHKLLSLLEHGVVRATGYRTNRSWHFLAAREHNLISMVVDWWHEYQQWNIDNIRSKSNSGSLGGHLDKLVTLKGRDALTDPRLFAQFMVVARAIVQRTRNQRDISYGASPPSTSGLRSRHDRPENLDANSVSTAHERDFFDGNHRSILLFLVLAIQGQMKPKSQASSVASMIVRETGLYDHIEDHRNSLIMFLQELGVLSPWDGHEIRLINSIIPGYDIYGLADQAWERAVASMQIGRESFQDRMSHLRRDWAELDVYCVDAESTTTIDDGFSIERVAGTDSEIWIHTHIANPTAFLASDHPITDFARILSNSVYLPDTYYGMMPSAFISQVASLEKDRPCLTFSAKLDSEGNIVDQEITPGIVRNVHFMTPRTLEEATTTDRKAPSGNNATFQAPGDVTSVSLDRPSSRRTMVEASGLSEKQLADLKLYRDFADARFRGRTAISNPRHLNPMYPRGSCEVKVQGAERRPPNWQKVRSLPPEPSVQLHLFQAANDMPSHGQTLDLVAEAMLLAGTVAASWCARRGVPVPYRVSATPEGMPSRQDFIKEYIDPLLEAEEPIPLSTITEMMNMTRSRNSIAPKEHQDIGVEAYLRVTSPLRRYVDMLAHYQIEAALRQEAKRGSSGTLLIKEKELEYSAGQMADEMRNTLYRSRQTFLFSRHSRTRWIVHYLARAFHHQKDGLPKSLTVRLGGRFEAASNDPATMRFIMDEFRILCEAENASGIDESEMIPGDLFEAEITGVSVEKQTVKVKLLRLKHRPSKFIDPSTINLSGLRKSTSSPITHV